MRTVVFEMARSMGLRPQCGAPLHSTWQADREGLRGELQRELCDECLNELWFVSLADAEAITREQ